MEVKVTLLLCMTSVWAQSRPRFAPNFYNEISKNYSGNFVVSPASLQLAFWLTYIGANGSTHDEIETSLNLPINRQEPMDFHAFSRDKNIYVVKSIYKIYIDKGLAIKDEFKEQVQQTTYESVDLTEPCQTANTINTFIAKKTKDRIRRLVRPKDLPDENGAVLVNALHFTGLWQNPLQWYPELEFYVNGNNLTNVTGLGGILNGSYYHDATLNATFLELPFRGPDATFTVVFPDETTGLETLEKNITELLKRPLHYETGAVKIKLPQINIETHLNDVKETLQKIGVRKVFVPKESELSGIAGEPGELYLDRVLQKNLIGTNTLGVASLSESFPGSSLEPFSRGDEEGAFDREVNVNRPFIFYIKVNNLPFSVGRVVEPGHVNKV